jgi:hypothetical protein
MSEITPKAGKKVDTQNLDQFKAEINFLLEGGWRQKHIGELINISEANFHGYLYGKNKLTITHDILTQFRFIFKDVLKHRLKVSDGVKEPTDSSVKEEETEDISFERFVEEALVNIQKDLADIKKKVFRNPAEALPTKKPLPETPSGTSENPGKENEVQ